MGFDVNRFREEPGSELICSVCDNVLESPVQGVKCGHCFCRKCISKLKGIKKCCPIDKQPLKGLHDAPERVDSLLGNLKMSCDFSSNGCPEYVKRDLFEAHAKACRFKPRPVLVKCLKGCGGQYLRSEGSSHSCLTFPLGLVEAKDKDNETVRAENLMATEERQEAEAEKLKLNDEVRSLIEIVAKLKNELKAAKEEMDRMKSFGSESSANSSSALSEQDSDDPLIVFSKSGLDEDPVVPHTVLPSAMNTSPVASTSNSTAKAVSEAVHEDRSTPACEVVEIPEVSFGTYSCAAQSLRLENWGLNLLNVLRENTTILDVIIPSGDMSELYYRFEGSRALLFLKVTAEAAAGLSDGEVLGLIDMNHTFDPLSEDEAVNYITFDLELTGLNRMRGILELCKNWGLGRFLEISKEFAEHLLRKVKAASDSVIARNQPTQEYETTPTEGFRRSGRKRRRK